MSDSQTINHRSYQVIKKISSGGMADIVLCSKTGDHGFRKKCIIKKISKNLLHNNEVQQLFFNEMKIHCLLHHPNIVQLFDFKEQGNTYLLILEYVPGWSLRAIIDRAKRSQREVPITFSLKILSEVAEALHYLHELYNENDVPLELIHRDISPENILISPQGIAKICDFGLSRGLMQNVDTQTGILRGKISYMSPEQLKGRLLDFRSDLYSAGLCLVELLALPSASGKDDWRKIKHLWPPALAKLVTISLQIDPRDRFAASREFLRSCQAAYREALIETATVDIYDFLTELFASSAGASGKTTHKPLEVKPPRTLTIRSFANKLGDFLCACAAHPSFKLFI